MNIQKFTQKSVEAINDCEKLAYEYGNQEIEQEHLLVALMRQEDGLIPKLIEKMEIQKEHFMDNAERHLAARVKVSGGQVYVGQDLNKVLIHAEDEAKQMGDEYVSVEHLFLALIKYPNKALKEIFKEYGITRERFLQALSTVRGNQRVTSDNPEATYDTLEKYGYDMVARARDQKLDPVFGRGPWHKVGGKTRREYVSYDGWFHNGIKIYSGKVQLWIAYQQTGDDQIIVAVHKVNASAGKCDASYVFADIIMGEWAAEQKTVRFCGCLCILMAQLIQGIIGKI